MRVKKGKGENPRSGISTLAATQLGMDRRRSLDVNDEGSEGGAGHSLGKRGDDIRG